MKNRGIKLYFGALLFVLVSFVPAKGFKYVSEEGKFSINFPSEVSTQDMSTTSYKSIQAQSNLKDQLFFATHNIHETTLTDQEALAETSLKSFVDAMQGTIISQEKWVVNKNNGLKAKLDIPSLNLIGEYNIVIIGQIQYQLAVVSELDNWSQVETDKFLKSFKVKK